MMLKIGRQMMLQSLLDMVCTHVCPCAWHKWPAQTYVASLQTPQGLANHRLRRVYMNTRLPLHARASKNTAHPDSCGVQVQQLCGKTTALSRQHIPSPRFTGEWSHSYYFTGHGWGGTFVGSGSQSAAQASATSAGEARPRWHLVALRVSRMPRKYLPVTLPSAGSADTMKASLACSSGIPHMPQPAGERHIQQVSFHI